ncbi:unnamed protein product [Adineta steineri]|uniref:Uncharacterized protein n=1 Tax=Adineta steineri TaxID=433720 RepID=A0A819FAA0_9BILA|nr:unnamed protein product [Adineta steineri]
MSLIGVVLSFGGLFCLTVGGGSTLLVQSFGLGIHKTIQAAVFPIGLILVIATETDLFTGNTIVLVISTLHKKTTWINRLISWSISFFGNLINCLCFQYFLVYHAGLLTYDPYLSYTIKYAELKGNTPWHQMFLRRIAGNWLLGLAFCLSASARDLNSKIIGIYLPIWLFVAVGYEYSIANMFTVQICMVLGANLSIGNYILNVLISVTLGNILGGVTTISFIHYKTLKLSIIVLAPLSGQHTGTNIGGGGQNTGGGGCGGQNTGGGGGGRQYTGGGQNTGGGGGGQNTGGGGGGGGQNTGGGGGGGQKTGGGGGGGGGGGQNTGGGQRIGGGSGDGGGQRTGGGGQRIGGDGQRIDGDGDGGGGLHGFMP